MAAPTTSLSSAVVINPAKIPDLDARRDAAMMESTSETLKAKRGWPVRPQSLWICAP